MKKFVVSLAVAGIIASLFGLGFSVKSAHAFGINGDSNGNSMPLLQNPKALNHVQLVADDDGSAVSSQDNQAVEQNNSSSSDEDQSQDQDSEDQ